MRWTAGSESETARRKTSPKNRQTRPYTTPGRKKDVGPAINPDDPDYAEKESVLQKSVEEVRKAKLDQWKKVCESKTCRLGIHTADDFRDFLQYEERRMDRHADLAQQALLRGQRENYEAEMRFLEQIFHHILEIDHCFSNDLGCKTQRRHPLQVKPVEAPMEFNPQRPTAGDMIRRFRQEEARRKQMQQR